MSVDITVTIIVTDQDGDPVEGIRVDLHGKHGFYGEDSTDGDGIVEFDDIPGWQTVDLWIDHEDVGELGLEGHDETFTHSWENEFKYHSSDEEEESSDDE